MIEPYVYPPRDREEMELWLDEHRDSIACRNAIDEAIREGLNNAHLQDDGARKTIEEFGIQRVELVLAATVQDRSMEEGFSRQTLDWAKCRTLAPMERCSGYVLTAAPEMVDGFVRQYLQTVEEMARGPIKEEEGQSFFPEMRL